MRVFIWYEGRRLGDFKDAVSVECDGDKLEVHTEDDGVEVWDEDEWDDFTVHDD